MNFDDCCGFLKALLGKFKSKVMSVAKSINKVGKDDPRRVIHSVKMGIALTIVSLFYYLRPLYDTFGVAGMWAVLTVIFIFEFTVGATLSKGIYRGIATIFAGALAVGGQQLATVFGERGEPYVHGVLVFILVAVSTFIRFFPKIKAKYDYGVIIFILTFSLLTVSGYKVEKLYVLAHQRLSTVSIGGAVCILISLFICPFWAGEDLHKLVASNIEKLAKYLEGFEDEYFQCKEDERKPEKSVMQGYTSVLNSKASEDSLANFARWEPGHGQFLLRHPWKQYLKIGALARECAYKIEALNGYLNPEIQESLSFKCEVQQLCTKMCSESCKALKAISSSIKTMTDPSAAKFHIENSKTAVEELKFAVKTVSMEGAELLAIVPVVTVATTLVEITKSVEKIYLCVSVLSQLAKFKKSVEISASSERTTLLHRGIINPVVENDDSNNHIGIIIQDTASVVDSTHQKRKMDHQDTNNCF